MGVQARCVFEKTVAC